jgi:molybdenum cofactor cytidylyltransferase
MSRQNKIVALILAAGLSSRMGEFKPLLSMNGVTVVESAVNCFRQAGIADIRVVVGHQAERLMPVLQSLGVLPVLNENFALGMFSSVRTGLQTFASAADGFFLLPGDMPLVKSCTLEKLVKAYRETDCPIIYPTFFGRRGHPPLISHKCFQTLLSWQGPENLRLLLQQFEQDAYNVPVIDQAILFDMDTPVDYEKLLRSTLSKNIPTVQECKAIFAEYDVSPSIVRHGKAVARVARQIAARLNQGDCYDLNIELIVAGSLLHDIAKGRPHHAKAGAMILDQLGFPTVSKVVASHMDLNQHDQAAIDEVVLVYFADKLIKEESLIPVVQHFSETKLRYVANESALKAIEKRLKKTLVIQDKLEHDLGISNLFALLSSEEVRYRDDLSE